MSQQPGIQVQTVAVALAIHPFMLSKWRKDMKDGRLRGRPPNTPPAGPAREIAQLQALERKYAEFTQHQGHHVAPLCRRHDVTPSGFYAWRRRQDSAHAIQDRTLTAEIVRRFARHGECYGSPRLYREVVNAGWAVSRRRVARLMRAAGRRAKAVRGYRAKANIRTRYAQHPNRLWATRVTRLDQVWVGDITYLRVRRGWRYLAIVMDQHSRRLLAWTLTRRRTAEVTCRVLELALERRRPLLGLIFHSDRGCEYMGAPFCAVVAQHGLLQSANVPGAGDNAHAESFFHSLKAELTCGETLLTDRALRIALTRYIQYYNGRRMHSALGYQSPIAFERHVA